MSEKIEKFRCEICHKEYVSETHAENCEKECRKLMSLETHCDNIRERGLFDVTKNHLKLLQRMNTNWWECEFGAPAIDPKRPYGNSSVYADILEILKIKTKFWNTEQEDITTEGQEYCNVLHREMEIVLEILVQNLKIKIGKYFYIDYKWVE